MKSIFRKKSKISHMYLSDEPVNAGDTIIPLCGKPFTVQDPHNRANKPVCRECVAKVQEQWVLSEDLLDNAMAAISNMIKASNEGARAHQQMIESRGYIG